MKTLTALGIASLVALAGCSAPPASAPASPSASSAPAAAPAPAPAPAPTPEGTVSQRNALKKAESYLVYLSFSRQGLIEQLKFDGFSVEDATWGVDRTNADWNEQAVKQAQSYLQNMSFSRSGLINQMVFSGYTQEQAEHAADMVGL